MDPAKLLSGTGDVAGGVAALIPPVFGTSQSGATSGTSTTSGSTTQKLNLDQDAIAKIIQDVLGGADGLASIFSGEQNAGLYNASATAQAAGDLASKLVGELAKLTAESETTQSTTTVQDSSTEGDTGNIVDQAGGLLDSLFGGLF